MKFTNICAFFAAILAMLLSSCTSRDYADVIPADAELVLSIDVDDLAEQGDFIHSASMDFIKQYLNVVCDGKGKDDACNYLDEPAKMGLDLRVPIYIYKTNTNFVGVAIKVYDKGKVDDFVDMLHSQGVCSKPREKDGVQHAALLDDIALQYDGDVFMLCGSVDGQGIKSANAFLSMIDKMTDEQRFTSTPEFERMQSDTKHKILLYGNMGLFPESVEAYIAPLLPPSVKMSELSLFTGIEFETGKLEVNVEVTAKTDNAKAALEKMNANTRNIQGRYLDTAPKDFLVYSTLNANGTWLLENLKDDKRVNQYLIMIERAIDIEQMIRSVDGDICIMLPKVAFEELKQHKLPDCVVTAQLANKNFLADVSYWQQSMREYGLSMRQTAPDCYVLSYDGEDVYWGVDGDDLYLASGSAFRTNSVTQRSELLAPYDDMIRNSSIFTYINLKSVPLIDFYMIPVVGKAIQHLKCVIAKTDCAERIDFILELDNKNENFLKEVW